MPRSTNSASGPLQNRQLTPLFISSGLRRDPIRQRYCRGGPHDAANGRCDLNQASRVCVVFFEELGGSMMMPRGLIGMTHCGGGVFQACTRCGHVSSELAMLLAAS